MLGFAATGVWLTFVPGLLSGTIQVSAEFAQLSLGLRCAAVVQLPLIAGILVVAQQRFWSSDYADGSAPVDGSRLDINRRYLTNTLEQSVIATVGLLALSVTVARDNIAYLPALASLFVIGRMCFWVGYHINPYARAFGLVLTLAPTLGVYVFLLSTLSQP